jgi:hypothetical protein
MLGSGHRYLSLYMNATALNAVNGRLASSIQQSTDEFQGDKVVPQQPAR